MELSNLLYFLGLLFMLEFTKDLTTVNAEDLQYAVLKHRKSWLDSDADCRSRQGRLLVLDTHSKVVEFQTSHRLEAKETYWTAAYRKHSPWLWVEGCFSAKYIQHEPVRIPNNQAFECAQTCDSTTYAALRGNLCFCLEDMRELLPLDSSACSRPCTGSKSEMCGGPEAVSLYSTGGVKGFKESVLAKGLSEDSDNRQNKHETSRADWKNCVYILKHETPVWITADCRKPLPFLCKIYRENGAITEYKSPPGVRGSWTEARDLCRQEGGTLADLHSRDVEAVSALPDHSEYWVGLYRNTSWAWHTGMSVQHPSWCTSFSEDENGQLTFQTESCSLPHNYVCQIAKPETGVADASHLAVFVACGTVAWLLALATVIVTVYLIKKRKCRRVTSDESVTQFHSNYIDLNEETMVSRQNSYVNSQATTSCSSVQGDSSCASGQSSGTPPDKQKAGASGSQPGTPGYYTINGNEYATVTFMGEQQQGSSKGDAGNRKSRDGSGDYDHVWDSLKFNNFHLRDENIFAETLDSENTVYAQVHKPKSGTTGSRDDYVTTHSKLFPPTELLREEVPSGGKTQVSRMRSKSL